jgi:hypothetical protein
MRFFEINVRSKRAALSGHGVFFCCGEQASERFSFWPPEQVSTVVVGAGD